MLAWRAASRRPPILRPHGTHIPRRLLHVSLPRAQYQQLRAPGLYAKFRFRKDGQPRSRLMGAFVGSSLLLNLLLASTLTELIDSSEQELGILSRVFFVQRVDYGYGAVNLDDPTATLDYFKRLLQAFTAESDDSIETFIAELFRLLRQGGQSNPETHVHAIMRFVAENIHQALENMRDDDTMLQTVKYMLAVVSVALEDLCELVDDDEDEDDESSTKHSFQLIRDHSKKDGRTTIKDYESLG